MGFFFRGLKPDDPYYPCWVEMRRRRWVCCIGVLVWIPATLVLGGLLTLLLGRTVGFICTVLPFLVGWFALDNRRLSWPCPRCGQPFYSSRGMWPGRPLADNCLHCGLMEYAPSDQC